MFNKNQSVSISLMFTGCLFWLFQLQSVWKGSKLVQKDVKTSTNAKYLDGSVVKKTFVIMSQGLTDVSVSIKMKRASETRFALSK